MASDLLTDKAIANAKPSDKPRTLKDGDGLFVLIHPNGSKYFQVRCSLHGKEKIVRLGIYKVNMTLAEARTEAVEIRKLIAKGIDPIQAKRMEAAEQASDAEATFRVVASEWLEMKRNILAPSTHGKIVATFNANIYPKIGDLPVVSITSPLLLSTLRRMEARGALELMSKCRAWLRKVFDYAKATGKLKGDNPASCLVDVLKKPIGNNFPTFQGESDHGRKDAGEFLRRLTEYHGRPETKLAIWLLLLTAKRPSELREASWSEFDLDNALWRIPKERMKLRAGHLVPLSRQAVAALQELHELTGYNTLLFPGNNPTKPISEMTLTKAFKLIWPEYRVVPHGCRHFFSTLANEYGHFRHDVIEVALAHGDPDEVRGTYNKATYIKERRQLSQWWADELEAMRIGGKVVTGKFGKVA